MRGRARRRGLALLRPTGGLILIGTTAACAGWHGPALKDAVVAADRFGAGTQESAAVPVFDPLDPPETLYAGEATSAVPLAGLAKQLLEAASEAAHTLRQAPLRADPRLHKVAANLAAVAPQGHALPVEVIEFLLSHHGVAAPLPRVLVLWGAPTHSDRLCAHVRSRILDLLARSDYNRVGVASVQRSERQWTSVVVLQRSYVELARLPRAHNGSRRVKIRGRVLGPYQEPKVYAFDPWGQLQPLPDQSEEEQAKEFEATVDCRARHGRHRIQLVAAGPDGRVLLADFPLWCQSRPPSILALPYRGERADPALTRQAERHMVVALQRARQEVGLPPLKLDRKISLVARRYAREMAWTGVVTHVSALSGTVDDRVRRVGIRVASVRENLVRAPGVQEAHAGLMASAHHRDNILSDKATHVGVGVAVRERPDGTAELFVTQVFTRVPPRIDLREARATLLGRLKVALNLQIDVDLDRIAQHYANEMSRARGDELMASLARHRVGDAAGRRASVRLVVWELAALDQFDADRIEQIESMTHFGLGIAQGSHRRFGRGVIYVVGVFAQARGVAAEQALRFLGPQPGASMAPGGR